jgi:hypothetical protein
VLVHYSEDGLTDYNFSMRRRSYDGEEINLVSDAQVGRSSDREEINLVFDTQL